MAYNATGIRKEETMKSVITISRQFASGGREIGAKLSEELGIPFYDHEIITRAAKESGFAEAAFNNVENKASNSLLYSIAMGMSSYGSSDFGFSQLSLDDRIYFAQSNVIQRVARESSCVIVGRCADYILKGFANVVNIFICADMDFRIKRALDKENMSPSKIEDAILKYDKKRANYYYYHASERWGKAENYHLSLKSSSLGIDSSVGVIAAYVRAYEANNTK